MKNFVALLMTGTLFCFTTVQAATEAPPILEVSFNGHGYHVEQKGRKFIFHGHGYAKTLAVESCNAELVEEFFSRFERYSREYSRHPASVVEVDDAPAVSLNVNGKPTKVASASRLGRWLRDLTGEVHRLSARSTYRCKED